MINLTEKNDIEPICPHCEKDIHNLWFRELGGLMGKRYIYFCNHCRKTLGVSHRKGFWMG